MCNRYISPEAGDVERAWHIGARQPWRGGGVYPRSQGPFVRAADSAQARPELVVGQWGLIPWFAKTPKLTFSTNNARSEELASKATFKDPWRYGKRCIIPALSFDEPNWESGKNVWWSFTRADGDLWALAGLWNAWTDKATGEIHESYTMLTINADAHPLMKRMHKPEVDPATKQVLPPEKQDKRSVVVLERPDFDVWLHGSQDDAKDLIQLAPVEVFRAGPTDSPEESPQRAAVS